MAGELTQDKDAYPIINPPSPKSTAKGSMEIAQVLGNIADRAAQKSADYASEASKTNLLQTKSMLDDISDKSRLEMARSPEHSIAIAQNAEQTAERIKANARLNREDKVNLDLAAHNVTRELSFKAQEKQIAITNESAKYATLSAFNSTLQDINNSLFTNPEAAEKTIEAQYQSLAGQVRSGILTAVEAANLHKQLEHEVDRAAIILEGYKNENLTASHVNALHAASPNPQPFSNANLPMTHDTMFHADSHLTHLSTQDIKSKWATGEYVPPQQLAGVKTTESLQSLLVYKAGAAQASGDIFSGVSWPELKKRLDVLKKSDRLSTEQSGYKDRLNNYIVGIENGNQYSNYISQTPAGSRAYLDFSNQNAVIAKHAYFGDEASVEKQRHDAYIENLNGLVSKIDSVGIGADVPDQYRNPIPAQYVQPVVDAFKAGANPAQAINNIAIFNPKNRASLANSIPNPRQALTVYETGQLLSKGADQGFLSDFWHSQQDSMPTDAKRSTSGSVRSQFLELNDKQGKSINTIRDTVNSKMAKINQYFSSQANNRVLLNASTEKAVRYVQYMAEKNGDATLSHMDDYVDTYVNNMQKSYDVATSYNYMLDRNIIPIDDAQMGLLSKHAINSVETKLHEYMNDAQVKDYMSKNQLRLVNTTLGRIEVVNGAGQLIPDKDGHAAYSELYNAGILNHAEHAQAKEEEGKQSLSFGYKGFL